jgi:hypothetical protein
MQDIELKRSVWIKWHYLTWADTPSLFVVVSSIEDTILVSWQHYCTVLLSAYNKQLHPRLPLRRKYSLTAEDTLMAYHEHSMSTEDYMITIWDKGVGNMLCEVAVYVISKTGVQCRHIDLLNRTGLSWGQTSHCKYGGVTFENKPFDLMASDDIVAWWHFHFLTQSCLITLVTISSALDLLWQALSTVGPCIDWCVCVCAPFQIMSNQLNSPQVDSNQVV